jgi:hypothetical protein
VKAKKTEKTESMKRFRAVVTIEFEAPDRETAMARAKELYDSPQSKVRVQEQVASWLTLGDPTA